LKGTLPATVIEPKEPKKKMTKEEKQDAISKLGLEIKSLKAVLITETRKGKRAEATRKLSKANRELKKLM
jgi:predicted translin family RNA/ssDNA-binding protein